MLRRKLILKYIKSKRIKKWLFKEAKAYKLLNDPKDSNYKEEEEEEEDGDFKEEEEEGKEKD